MRSFISLLFAICPLLAGLATGYSFSQPGDPWYQQLVKPDWTPPPWIFGPVWTALYLAMGISAAVIWRGQHPERHRALAVYGLQLACNLAWTPLFFGWHRLHWALLDLGALIASVVWTTVGFAAINRFAAGLLLPYLAWTIGAFALNFRICQLNG